MPGLTKTVHQLDHNSPDMEISSHSQGPLHLEVRHEDGELPGPVPVHLLHPRVTGGGGHLGPHLLPEGSLHVVSLNTTASFHGQTCN